MKRLIRNAGTDVKTMPSHSKNSDFHLALADYLFNELKKMKIQVSKPKDLIVHLALENTIDQRYNGMVLDCLDGKVYLKGDGQKDRLVGKLRNFKGGRASDAYHCMKSSLQSILKRVDKYKNNVIDYRIDDKV